MPFCSKHINILMVNDSISMDNRGGSRGNGGNLGNRDNVSSWSSKDVNKFKRPKYGFYFESDLYK